MAMSQLIIFDAHVHFYPEYNAAVALDYAQRNLRTLAVGLTKKGSPVYALCLTERADCHFFKSLKESKRFPGIGTCDVADVNGALKLTLPEQEALFIIPGRQIISTEKLEILSFGADVEIPDRSFPVEIVFELIRKAGGIPVVNWAPGKWWFKRGKIVNQIILSASAGECLLCDTTLRPLGYCLPHLMKKAELKGIKILKGSDPLPLPGEEVMLGRYVTLAEAEFDSMDPIGSLKQILIDSEIRLEQGGSRSNLLEWGRRMLKFYSTK